MGRKNLYFLVARNRDTNDFQIVDTTSSYGSSLEEIDLFTMRFENEKDLLTCLQKKGKTTSNDLDFFVAYQKKEKNERRLHFKEVLYSSGERIHDIALASSQGELEDKKREVSYIFYDFCERMRHDQSFYDRVLFGKTDLFAKFTDYFSDRRYLDTVYVKYKDGGWIFKSYPLIRGMVEVMRSYEKDPYGKSSNEDIEKRQLLGKDLLKVTDWDYDPNQITLFDFMGQDPLGQSLIAHHLLDEKEVDNTDGYAKRKTGEGTH